MDRADEENWVRKAVREELESRGVDLGILKAHPFVVADSIVSKMYVVDVRMGESNLSLVCKLLEDEPVRTNFKLLMQYFNETLFYSEMLPFMLDLADGEDDISQIFPRFHFSHHDDLQCLVALENLAPLGYKRAQKTLDLRHSIVALQALGRFHALSYIAKRKQPEQFHAFTEKVQYPRKFTSMSRMLEYFNFKCVQHTVSLFRESQPEEAAKYSSQLQEIIDDAMHLYGKLYEGREPMAVICHGDYKMENMLFKYDEDENPLTVKIIDFQLISYSSPAIDVFLLLFLNTTPEILENHWNTLIVSYHEALLEAVSRSLKCSLESLQESLGLEAFKIEFKKYCLHGFYISNFFKPVQNLEPEKFAAAIKIVSDGVVSLEKLEPLFADMSNIYNDEMKKYVIGLLQQVLKFKVFSLDHLSKIG